MAWLVVGWLMMCLPAAADERRALAGHYVLVKGGFNETITIDLRGDGSYLLKHGVFACVVGPNEDLSLGNNMEEGTWRIERNVVFLDPRARTTKFFDGPMFAPALARALLPRRVWLGRMLVSRDFPEEFKLKKTGPPNMTFEPATRSTARGAGEPKEK